MSTTFVETDCMITHEGKTFESGGSYLVDCTDGYRRGVVYAKPIGTPNTTGCPCVTTWHGEYIASAHFGREYRGNFCRMQSVSFTLDGVRYTGRYCPDWSQAVKVRSTRIITEY